MIEATRYLVIQKLASGRIKTILVIEQTSIVIGG